MLKRLQRWIQNKSGIGENRDALADLRRRVDALAAIQQQHLPELLVLPSVPSDLGGASPHIHRADAMYRYPLSASGGTWSRATEEYFATGRDMAGVLKSVAPDAQSILDFGGGYGRVGRFIATQFPAARRWVYDPKAGAMAFQQTHWGAQPWDGSPVDLAFAGSVFTHLRPEDARHELARLTRSAQVVVVTLHDFRPSTEIHAVTEESLLPELEDQLRPEAYASVYFQEAEWKSLVPQGWTIEHLAARFGGTQRIAVLRPAEA